MSAALTLLLLVAQASSQDPRTGTLTPNGGDSAMVEEAGRVRGSDRAKAANAAAARRAANAAHQTMRQYASCLVTESDSSREREALIAFLNVSPDSGDADVRVQRTMKPACLYRVAADSVLLRFSPPLLRGEVFRELYLGASRTPHRASLTRAQISGAWQPDLFRGSFAATQRFADCVVAANPAAADALMRVKIGGDEQSAAVRGVAAHMGGCLQQTATLQMSRIVLEGVLAEALYRRVTTPAAAATLAGARQ